MLKINRSSYKVASNIADLHAFVIDFIEPNKGSVGILPVFYIARYFIEITQNTPPENSFVIEFQWEGEGYIGD